MVEAIHNKTDDMIPDPDMMIVACTDRSGSEAFTYQDAYIFTPVYTEDGSLVDDTERRSMNEFLHTWLGNLNHQG